MLAVAVAVLLLVLVVPVELVLDLLEPEMTAVHGPLLHGTVLVLCRVAGSPPWLAA